METRRWTNPTQPQTLQIAVFLLYINAAFGVLFGEIFFLFPVGLLLVIAQAAGGFGIANEKKWGYWLAVGAATVGLLPLAFVIVADGIDAILSITFIISMLFPVALFALLLHPMSRDYQRIWFR
jgi:phage-related holin